MKRLVKFQVDAQVYLAFVSYSSEEEFQELFEGLVIRRFGCDISEVDVIGWQSSDESAFLVTIG